MNYYAVLGLDAKKSINHNTVQLQYKKLKEILPQKVHPRLKKAARVLSEPVSQQMYEQHLKDHNNRHACNFKLIS